MANTPSSAQLTILESPKSECQENGQDKHASVLQHAKGTWLHAGYHLTTGTAGASTPNLPAAMAGLGWGFGLFFLTLFAAASFYTYYLLIIIVDHLEKQGKRCVRYQDVSYQLLGRKWSMYAVAPLQYVVCFTTVVSFVLLGGQTLKEIFVISTQAHEKLTLSEFIVIFGFISIILSQLPSFHSLRHLNLLSLIFSLVYTLLAVCGCIISGYSKRASSKDYSLVGTTTQKIANAFNALSILSTIYGNAVLVETQATVSPPTRENMVKGLGVCYIATVTTFFPVAIAGYWAFGNSSNGNIFLNMISVTGVSYIPSWMFILANMCMIVQLVAGSVLYSQPTFEIVERDIVTKTQRSSLRISIKRTILRTLFMGIATFLAAMLPFFSDFNALSGSMGYTPLVFIFPIIFFLIDFKIESNSLGFWTKCLMVGFFIIITAIGVVTSIRQLVLDEKTYRLFANI